MAELKTVRVRDYMTRKLVTLAPEMQILRAVHLLMEADVAGAPVLDGNGRLVGMLSEKDCMKVVLDASYYSEYGGTVAEYMSAEVVTVSSDEGIVEAAQRFLNQRYHRYPVVDDGRLVGQISRRDVLRALGDSWQ